MQVSFQGIGADMVTFEAAEGVQPGAAVKLSGAGKVDVCSAEEDIPIGVARSVQDGVAGVQTRGYMRMGCASTVTVGFHLLAANAAGKMASGTAGRPAFVVDVDTAAGTCGVLL